MRDATQTTMIPCAGCSRQMRVPRHYTSTSGNRTVFCSQRCNRAYVARVGTRRQEKALADRMNDA